MEDDERIQRGDNTGLIYPFRWNIKERSQLGSLIGEPSADREAWLDWQEVTSTAYRWRDTYTYLWFRDQLDRCAARVVAFSDNSDLCFVGRSPESLFDYLSGLLFDTSWANRLTLFHFSMYWENEGEILNEYPGALTEMRKYLTWLRLDPQTLASRERSVALVDIVDRGNTLGRLINVIHNWCKQTGCDWSAVQRKIRIVGLTEQQKTSPKTWRWQQQVEWVNLLAPGTIKNVSVSEAMFNFLGEGLAKTTDSYIPMRWGDPSVTMPNYSKKKLQGLRVVAALFDDGRDKTQRLRFAAELSKQSAMQSAWFRSLVQELKR